MRKFMKFGFEKIIFFSLALAIFGGSVSSFGQSPNKEEGSDSVAKAINAQIQVTRDNLQLVMKRMDELDTGSVYNDSDYKCMAPLFKQNVNQAMANFDHTMTQTIFPKAQYWLKLFQEYADPNQKDDAYLVAAAENTQMNLEVVQKLYRAAIAQIFIDGVGH